ncbi:hypothetical protein INT08_06930 [Prosthecochloris sp. N3]|uniref:Histidine kinase n=1 Tax=Prosthecochloris ethylica TaxID=2743976 RepID=A0ABR9XSE5_9CHLB|nr:hypothetical protein [Prosthecochloris ethylica]MBF0585369.1 hypothetical protein [Prosthecochloris ethylica]MBF0636905.1 hypothetical protein [Prosthecochloris ethylica]MEC9487055.1 hypothetical protein [Prosthecochloris sp.]NUK46598.1 hypothetical protein [Prosthecochloris ethylica]
MKKTAKILSIAALAGLAFTPAAQAEGFDVGADVVSRYVWRGTEFGEGVAVQPWLSYTFPGIGVEVGSWGSFDINDDDANEVDLYLTVPAGNFSFTVTDYYFPGYIGDDDFFEYDDETGAHVLELSAGYAYENLSLLGAVNVLGDEDNSLYFEAGYNIYEQDDYSASVFVGAGDGIYTDVCNSNASGDFNVVAVGLNVSKDIFNASYIINPDQETSYLVFGVTLQP